MRLFVALIPPPRLQACLAGVQASFAAIRARAFRWVPRENLHLTLQFLGPIEDQRICFFEKAFASVAEKIALFSLRVGGLGCFPTPLRPAILWSGITSGKTALEVLQRSVTLATTKLGVVPEARPFQGHLTLARLTQMNARERASVCSQVKLLQSLVLGDWKIEHLHLVMSNLSSSGARYETIGSWRLQGGTRPP